MRQIYDFERNEPPVLSERSLLAQLEQKRAGRQTMAVALCALLSQIVVLLTGYMAMETCPLISFASACYVTISIAGGSAVALVYAKKKENEQYE